MLTAIISGKTQINAPATSLGCKPVSAPCNPWMSVGKRAMIGSRKVILEEAQRVPNNPSPAIPRLIPKKASKLRVQPRGRSPSRATAKKTPNPKTIPLIFGRL